MPLHEPPLQIARGIYSEEPSLSWGEPASAYVPYDGGAHELVWIGGHDGENKLVGGGLQDSNGEPTFPAPRGAIVFDYLDQYIWISTGWQDDPYGLFQSSNPTEFLGWTAFCPCITSDIVPSSSGASSGAAGPGGTGGGAGLVVTPCCPAGVEPTLFLSITSPWTSNYQLTWNGAQQSWLSGIGSILCGDTPTDVQFGLRCQDGTWELGVQVSNTLSPGFWGSGTTIFEPTLTQCSPFELSQKGGSPVAGPTDWYCAAGSTLAWSVDD